MKKTYFKYYLILGLSIAMLITWEVLKEKPIDWTFTLDKNDKIPYGTYVLYNTLEDIFPENKIINNSKTLYEYKFTEKPAGQSFIFITPFFNMPELDQNILLDYVKQGSNVFIATQNFSKKFSDTLNMQVADAFALDHKLDILNFTNPKLKTKKGYHFGKALDGAFFSKIDTAKTIVLGRRNKEAVNFIKVSFGKGNFYLNTQPATFTNYNMLDSANAEYAYKSISYLPFEDVVWDNYRQKKDKENSFLRYIMKNPSLKAGYTLLAISLLFYVFFTAKRKQRIISVMKPFKNTSLEFTQTVARVYLHNSNHKDIALKKFTYLLDFIRKKYFLILSKNELPNYENIAEKTGTDVETIQKIFLKAKEITDSKGITSAHLLEFNNIIETFYKTCI